MIALYTPEKREMERLSSHDVCERPPIPPLGSDYIRERVGASVESVLYESRDHDKRVVPVHLCILMICCCKSSLSRHTDFTVNVIVTTIYVNYFT